MPKTLYKGCSDDTLLAPVREYVRQWGKVPSYRLWRTQRLKPSTNVLVKRFGSWSAVQYKARGLPMKETPVNGVHAPYMLETQLHPDYAPRKPYELPISFLKTER